MLDQATGSARSTHVSSNVGIYYCCSRTSSHNTASTEPRLRNMILETKAHDICVADATTEAMFPSPFNAFLHNWIVRNSLLDEGGFPVVGACGE